MIATYRALGWRFRTLTPDQERTVKAAHAAGGDVTALAHAYGVSRRTIYRAIRRADRPRHVVTIEDRRATFEVEDGTPVQVTPWVPA